MAELISIVFVISLFTIVSLVVWFFLSRFGLALLVMTNYIQITGMGLPSPPDLSMMNYLLLLLLAGFCTAGLILDARALERKTLQMSK